MMPNTAPTAPPETRTDAQTEAQTKAMDARIRLHTDSAIMEADFSDFVFDSSATVNRFYDRIEERISETGETWWFFLVNLCGTRIDSAAWFAYARRGRALNEAHSMGSVRFDASDETRWQIERAAETEAFDPNLHACRDSALARIAQLPNRRGPAPVRHEPTYTEADFHRRVQFHTDTGIMEVDFSHVTFHHRADVDGFYDHIEQRIGDTGRRWFFLINYEGTRILPAAWVRFADRGKRLNRASSLGTLRYAPGSETEADIRLRAESQEFRPNIRNTRDEALAAIRDMQDAAQG